MKRKTSNAEWPIIRWIGDGRVKEDAPEYGAARKTDSTLNAQRPTSNGKGICASTSKSDFSNLVRGLFDWLMRFRIRERAIMLLASFYAAALLRMATTAK